MISLQWKWRGFQVKSKSSGRFVLRMQPQLHDQLRKEARILGCSMNELVINRLNHTSKESSRGQLLDRVVQKWRPLGVIHFGSTVRGEALPHSDEDWLIVLPETTPLKRSLYQEFDKLFEEASEARKVSPHFVHLPKSEMNPTTLWLEVALDGQWLTSPSSQLKETIQNLKIRIASGEFWRKVSHGQPYWVQSTKQE